MIYLIIGLLLSAVPFIGWMAVPFFSASRKFMMDLLEDGLMFSTLNALNSAFNGEIGNLSSAVEFFLAGLIWAVWCMIGLLIFSFFVLVWPILAFAVPGSFIIWIRTMRQKKSANEIFNKA